MSDEIIYDKYEYAGFYYEMHLVDGRVVAVPLPMQHKAAKAERHRRAAVECCEQECMYD